jgi:hypothetical protein
MSVATYANLLLRPQLEIDRCPHCQVDRPNLRAVHACQSKDHAGGNNRFWAIYQCNRCGGIVVGASRQSADGPVTEIFPKPENLSDKAIPERASHFLDQAIGSRHAPAGAVMLAASAVDAMLKAKNYKTGSLYDRINGAVADKLITQEMGLWAHDVRLDANDQRHSDENAPLSTQADADRVIEFAKALAQFLFILPARVARGRQAAAQTPQPAKT